MTELIDFSNSQLIYRSYGGSDQKLSCLYEGRVYMLKFEDVHEKKHDISTSYTNSVLSEYLGSHIAQSVGLPAHETLLGTYKGKAVVACLDFRGRGEDNLEFQELLRILYNSKDSRKFVRLEQIYSVYNNAEVFPESLRQRAIERFWDTFIVDSLLGNFDRHTGNWGFLASDRWIDLAPTYDYGSTLLPQLSDGGMEQIGNSDRALLERCYIFPSPVLYLTKEKTGKVGFYDMLASDYDKECSAALLRVQPKINLDKINTIIDDTPAVSDVRRAFYKKYLEFRKNYIIDCAYTLIKNGHPDTEAQKRLQTGQQFSQTELDTLCRRILGEA